MTWGFKLDSSTRNTIFIKGQIKQHLRLCQVSETAAVWFYRGILSRSQHKDLRIFCWFQLKQKRRQQRCFRELNTLFRSSLLQPLWAAAGFVTGFSISLFSSQFVLVCANLVEKELSQHFQNSLKLTEKKANLEPVNMVLAACQDQAQHAKENAAYRVNSIPNIAQYIGLQSVRMCAHLLAQISRWL